MVMKLLNAMMRMENERNGRQKYLIVANTLGRCRDATLISFPVLLCEDLE
jgi:hypothetical protein